MKKSLLIACALAPLILAAAPASARNYDCTKPGNANKSVCKGQTATAPAKPSPKAATPAPAKKAAAAPTATRNYDCSKAGNANKAVCKAAAPKPAAAPVTRVAPAPAPKPATAAAPRPAAPAAASRPTVAAGAATGKCKDGTETRAVNHRGACSRHGGVAAWY